MIILTLKFTIKYKFYIMMTFTMLHKWRLEFRSLHRVNM